MGPDIIVPIAGMVMVVSLALGIPLVRAKVRREERGILPDADAQAAQRLARIEAAVEAIAIEVERISEAQRFTTKLLADRTTTPNPGEPSR